MADRHKGSPAGHDGRRPADPFQFDIEFLAARGSDSEGPALHLAGVDEAGRGCLAGPLVAAGVILDYAGSSLDGLGGVTDSKLLTPAAREAIYGTILAAARRVAWVSYSPATIDRVGLHRCNLEALRKVVESLKGECRLALVDGFELQPPEAHVRSLRGADAKSAAVGAASILAKVIRDRLMRSLARLYPGYGFEVHMGYGTKAHREALQQMGPCALHRLSFRGVGSSQSG